MVSLSKPETLAGVAILLAAIFRLIYTRLFNKYSGLRLPPGPKALPLLGNILQLPAVHKERTFAEWGKAYGDVVFVRFLRTPVVILNSLQAAQDLLDKNSAKYSDRPQITIVSEMTGWDSSLVPIRYGDRFRRYRKWMHEALGTKAALKAYLPLQHREAYTFVQGLIERPEALRLHINRFAAALLVDMAYGHNIKSLDDPYVHLADKAMGEIVEGGYPGLMFVDFVPMRILKLLPSWTPGPIGWFIKKAKGVSDAAEQMLDTPYNMVTEAMASGTARPSMTSSVLSQIMSKGEVTKQDEIDIKGAAGVLYAAGTETTVSTLSSFILAMVMHPQVFKKARAEVDRVIGTGRLPELDDREHMPYLECLLKEVYRWGLAAPLGLVHKLMSDDEYRGYHIPGGSTVIANLWAMSRDERIYFEPESFRPERFSPQDGGSADLPDPRSFIFGFGRRVCPGRLMADDSLWLVMATVLVTLDIEKAQTPTGDEISPVPNYSSGFISQPLEFPYDIRARSKASVDLVNQMSANIVY